MARVRAPLPWGARAARWPHQCHARAPTRARAPMTSGGGCNVGGSVAIDCRAASTRVGAHAARRGGGRKRGRVHSWTWSQRPRCGRRPMRRRVGQLRAYTPAPSLAGALSTVVSTPVTRHVGMPATARLVGSSSTSGCRARVAPSPAPALTVAATRRRRVPAAAPRLGRVGTRALTFATRGPARRARCSSPVGAQVGTARRGWCRAFCLPLRARGHAGGGCGVASTRAPPYAT